MTAKHRDRPVPYLNRRDQYRMLAMVGLLCLVMVAIKFAAQPESWYWILPPDDERGEETVRLDELDFRVKQDADEPLPPDVFRAVAAADDTDTGTQAAGEDADDSPRKQAPPASIDINPDVLSGIEDNTVGVRRAEVEAYHLMLERIRRLPDAVIDAHADDDVAFTVIMLQSADYRGRLISVTGQLRRLAEYPVMENDRGIDRLYEGWVFTNDSGNNPWRFLCTELPAGAPLGDDVEPVKVQVIGYFFKRTGYLSHGGQHVAPTLLAKSFRILPTPTGAAPEITSELRIGILGFVGLVILALAVLMTRFYVADRAFSKSRLGELAAARLDADPEELEALKQVETIEPSEMFENVSTTEKTGGDGRTNAT